MGGLAGPAGFDAAVRLGDGGPAVGPGPLRREAGCGRAGDRVSPWSTRRGSGATSVSCPKTRHSRWTAGATTRTWHSSKTALRSRTQLSRAATSRSAGRQGGSCPTGSPGRTRFPATGNDAHRVSAAIQPDPGLTSWRLSTRACFPSGLGNMGRLAGPVSLDAADRLAGGPPHGSGVLTT